MGITNAMSNGNKNIEKFVLGMSHHKSIQTSLRYQKLSHEMFQNYNVGETCSKSSKEEEDKKEGR
jgi:hypothetical protein